jgi:ParB family chromosome partitioning protein
VTAILDNPTTTAPAAYELVPINEIIPAPDNVRKDLGDLDGLVASIQSVGLIEPLALERCDSSDHGADHRFHILAGERRWTAARRAGLAEVPCMVRDAVTDDGARVELMLIENLQRQDLQPMDEARGYQRLVELGLSQRTIADRVGCSQAHVSRRVALLELPTPVQAKVDTGGITVSDAHELLKLKDHPEALAKAAKSDHVADSVERAAKEIQAEEKLAKLAAAAKAKGWKVLKPERGYGVKRTYWPLRKPGAYGYGDDVEVDAAKHRKEPCHAVVLEKGWNGTVTQADVCTNRDRHKPKGESSLKLPKQARRQRSPHEQKELDEAKARKAAAARRVETLPPILARKPPAGEAVVLLARATIDQLGYDERKAACALLGLEQPQYRDDVLWAAAAKNDDELVRVAVACALARGHEAARAPHRYWSGSVTQLYDFLAARGYELDTFEQEQLKKARKSDEEDAASLAAIEAFRPADVRVVALKDGSWRVMCDYCGERDEDLAVVVEQPSEEQALAFRALHLTDLHQVRSCRVCSCTEDRACEGGCSWVDADLCSSEYCAANDAKPTAEQLEDLGVSQAVQAGVREMKDELDTEGATETSIRTEPITTGEVVVTVKKSGKRFKVSCSACGDVGSNTTEDYANERGRHHKVEKHGAEVPA